MLIDHENFSSKSLIWGHLTIREILRPLEGRSKGTERTPGLLLTSLDDLFFPYSHSLEVATFDDC